MSHIVSYPLPSHTDHVYATKHGVELPLRIFTHPTAGPGAPWLFFIHGGGFTTGQHWYPFPMYLDGFPRAGFHVVSISYRLMPHASLSEMVEDCTDALAWTRQHLSDFAPGVDLDRWVIAGASAGGSLSQIVTAVSDYKPKCFVNVYGAGDFISRVESSTLAGVDPKIQPKTGPYSGRFTEEELEAARFDRDISKAHVFCPNFLSTPADQLNKGWDTDKVVFDDRLVRHLDLRYYMVRHNVLIDTLLRKDEHPDQQEWETHVRKSSPRSYLSANYPPTVFLHGEADEVVPISNSKNAAQILRDFGVEVLEVYEPGMGHGFDRKYENPLVEGYATYVQPVIDFAVKHVKR